MSTKARRGFRVRNLDSRQVKRLTAVRIASIAILSLPFLFLAVTVPAGWFSGVWRRRITYPAGSVSPPHGIFINYRREDTGPYARLIQVRLDQCFPDAPVFMDLNSIEAGVDFAEAIESAVRSCAVLIVLIGRQWLTITDNEGKRRLDDPNDYVRFEIQVGLKRGIRVIPVLVDGTRAPQQRQLPDALHRLARLNALEMSYGRFEDDEARLMTVIRNVLRPQADGPTDVTVS
jgi:hypothetical protein